MRMLGDGRAGSAARGQEPQCPRGTRSQAPPAEPRPLQILPGTCVSRWDLLHLAEKPDALSTGVKPHTYLGVHTRAPITHTHYTHAHTAHVHTYTRTHNLYVLVNIHSSHAVHTLLHVCAHTQCNITSMHTACTHTCQHASNTQYTYARRTCNAHAHTTHNTTHT